MAEDKKKVAVGIGIISLATIAMVAVTKAKAAPSYPIVYDSAGVRDPEFAEGKPDGKFAYMTGGDSYLTFQLSAPKRVKEIHIYYIHQYTYNVGLKFDVEISVDEVNWLPVLMKDGTGHYIERAADDIFVYLVGASVKFVRISQWGGAIMGIDAIEVV